MEKKDSLPQMIAEKCPQCKFWGTFGTFWLPREIGDQIGRTGSLEERRRKWKSYGKYWTDGAYAVDVGGGQMVVLPSHTGGYYDEFKVLENPECPACGTPHSPDWPKVSVVCKKCGRNVIFDPKDLSVLCLACGEIQHSRDILLKPIV